MRRFLIGMAFFAAASPAMAADADGAYWSQRPENCREIRRVLGSQERTPAVMNLRGWVAGYITAYNRQTPETYDILGIKDFEDAMRFIDGFCKSQPLGNLTGAMEALTEELGPERHRTRRQAGK